MKESSLKRHLESSHKDNHANEESLVQTDGSYCDNVTMVCEKMVGDENSVGGFGDDSTRGPNSTVVQNSAATEPKPELKSKPDRDSQSNANHRETFETMDLNISKCSTSRLESLEASYSGQSVMQRASSLLRSSIYCQISSEINGMNG